MGLSGGIQHFNKGFLLTEKNTECCFLQSSCYSLPILNGIGIRHHFI